MMGLAFYDHFSTHNLRTKMRTAGVFCPTARRDWTGVAGCASPAETSRSAPRCTTLPCRTKGSGSTASPGAVRTSWQKWAAMTSSCSLRTSNGVARRRPELGQEVGVRSAGTRLVHLREAPQARLRAELLDATAHAALSCAPRIGG